MTKESKKIGAPTKYTPKLLKKAADYIDDYKENGDVIPSIEGLAEYLEISRTCIYTWREQEDKEEFSYILEKILSKQARVLINEGLKGEFNAAIAKLALGKHGYHDKQATELSGTVVGMTHEEWLDSLDE